MLCNDFAEVCLRLIDLLLDLLVNSELDWYRLWEVASDRLGVEDELVVHNRVAHVVVQSQGWGTIHHRVLADESSSCVLVHDKLQRLVEEAVLAVAMPELVCSLL